MDCDSKGAKHVEEPGAVVICAAPICAAAAALAVSLAVSVVCLCVVVVARDSSLPEGVCYVVTVFVQLGFLGQLEALIVWFPPT